MWYCTHYHVDNLACFLLYKRHCHFRKNIRIKAPPSGTILHYKCISWTLWWFPSDTILHYKFILYLEHYDDSQRSLAQGSARAKCFLYFVPGFCASCDIIKQVWVCHSDQYQLLSHFLCLKCQNILRLDVIPRVTYIVLDIRSSFGFYHFISTLRLPPGVACFWSSPEKKLEKSWAKPLCPRQLLRIGFLWILL